MFYFGGKTYCATFTPSLCGLSGSGASAATAFRGRPVFIRGARFGPCGPSQAPRPLRVFASLKLSSLRRSALRPAPPSPLRSAPAAGRRSGLRSKAFGSVGGASLRSRAAMSPPLPPAAGGRVAPVGRFKVSKDIPLARPCSGGGQACAGRSGISPPCRSAFLAVAVAPGAGACSCPPPRLRALSHPFPPTPPLPRVGAPVLLAAFVWPRAASLMRGLPPPLPPWRGAGPAA